MPPLSLHNTLSGQLEAFVPLNHTVRMYNCGPTVYERQTIGNLRGMLLADTLRRTLKAWGYPVKHVSNITDVGHLVSDADEGEDKIEKSAKAQGRSAQDIAREITGLYFADLDALGVSRKEILFPRATEYISEQIALVKTLEEKGYAYRTGDGVYFDTEKFPNYGKLARVNLAGEMAGARVEINKEKKNPHDFALWKFSKAGEQRQQEWESPWGTGFPGWHIECTAMIFKLLGKQIDIHIGGEDLAPIHHNNEIAQAEAVSGKQFVRYWMHNAFITIEGKKISKSLGNTVYLPQLADRGFESRALRYWYLSGHYRSPMNFTWDAIEGANTALLRLRRAYLEAPEGVAQKDFLDTFYAAIGNDLSTAQALALMWGQIKTLNKATLREADNILGLGLGERGPTAKLAVLPQTELPEEVRRLSHERDEARAAKDFAKADELRAAIERLGFRLEDSPAGPKISRK